jgi:hypothetical protein
MKPTPFTTLSDAHWRSTPNRLCRSHCRCLLNTIQYYGTTADGMYALGFAVRCSSSGRMVVAHSAGFYSTYFISTQGVAVGQHAEPVVGRAAAGRR